MVDGGARFLTVRQEAREEGQNKPCGTGLELKILLESKTSVQLNIYEERL